MTTAHLRATTVTTLVATALLSSLLLGLAAAPSDAQQTASCPDGYVLAADGTTCLSEAVDDNVTTTTSCLQGVLSDDGQYCIVPRLDAPAPPAAGGPTDAPVPAFTG